MMKALAEKHAKTRRASGSDAPPVRRLPPRRRLPPKGWTAGASPPRSAARLRRFLAAMMLLTVADVALRGAFNRPLRGVYELVELLLAGTFFLALPAVFLRDEHIVGGRHGPRRARVGPRAHAPGGGPRRVVLADDGLAGLAGRPRRAGRSVTSPPTLACRGCCTGCALLLGLVGAARRRARHGHARRGADERRRDRRPRDRRPSRRSIFARVPIAIALAAPGLSATRRSTGGRGP